MKKRVVVLGGRGFVGMAIVNELVQKGHKVMTFSRSKQKKLIISGENVEHVSGSILNLVDLKEAFSKVDVVVNLVGISPLQEPKQPNLYEKIHYEGVNKIISVLNKTPGKLLVQISALGADKNSLSRYLNTKARAEIELREKAEFDWVVLSPSIIFGRNNELDQQLKSVAWLKILPLPGFSALVQPIYVEDLARMVVDQIENPKPDTILPIVGSERISLYGLLESFARLYGLRLLKIPEKLVIPLLRVLLKLPLQQINRDALTVLAEDNVVENVPNYGFQTKSFSKWVEAEMM